MKDASVASGELFVVATPIGNLADISARALRVLSEVDCVVAEDTRLTRRLLDRHVIATPMTSLHAHNEGAASARIIARLHAGESIALVSDAGTPLLSDPGFELVSAARAAAIPVRPVPGPSAITAALSVAGLPTTQFWFEGFLPARGDARRSRLARLRSIPGTLVLFEAPHRVCECLDDLIGCFSREAEAAFARELTKMYEEIRRGSLGELRDHFQTRAPRGEFVLLVDNRAAAQVSEAEIQAVLEPLLEHLPLRDAAALASRLTGCRKNRAYELALLARGDAR